MQVKPNHQKRTAVAGKNTVELSEYKGLMPDAQSLLDLQPLIPNVGERWMAIAESEVSSRQVNERTIVTTYRNSTYLGMASAFIISLGILALALYAFQHDQFGYGVALVGGSLGTNVIAWLTRKRQD